MTQEKSVDQAEVFGFQTEVKQLLQLMIHSLYSNREIFLRELISNASDACDKLRFDAIENDGLYEGDGDLKIRVTVDKEARTVTISDNGIGMSRDEVVENLGTIARSGTKEFFGQLSGDASKDSQLIGQFGVGFYSAFTVADKVVVTSRRAGADTSDGVRWQSDGMGEFSIAQLDLAARGTTVTLHLREAPADDEEARSDIDGLLDDWRVKSVIRKYSDHISLPIQMPKPPEAEMEVSDTDKADDVEDAKVVDEAKVVEAVALEWETVNQASALWTRSRSEIEEKEYLDFYSNLTHDGGEPLAYTHNRVEGRTEYTQLLYVPGKAPYDIWDRENRRGLKLYVKRVFIMDDAQSLMPTYLRFVKGVIDSSDLPLNVSREILQESRDVKSIREGSTRRVLGMLDNLAENDADKYKLFWAEFGQVLKEGLGEDFGNAQRLAKLLRFPTTTSVEAGDETMASLTDYVARMKEDQDKIYYVTAESMVAAKNSPHLEVFKNKGIEVLLLTERVDEWMLNYLNEFDGKALTSVARGGVDLGGLENDEEKAEREKVADEFKPLVEGIEKALDGKVKSVRVTNRLTESAVCLVSDDGDISGNLERLLKQAGQEAPDRKPILEINPDHPILKHLAKTPENMPDWSALLFDQAMLAEGGQLENPAAYVKRQNDMMLAMLNRAS